MAGSEVFKLPLFHGTSTWFLPDILQRGFGAVNVHEELRSRDFLREVWDLRLDLAGTKEQEELVQWPGSMISHMIEDRVSRGGFNFRYGQFYCTAEERKAVSYAANRCGSELITEAAKLFDEVSAISSDRAGELCFRFPEIAPCLGFNHEPVVIRLEGVARQSIRRENSKTFTLDDEDFAQFLSFQVDTDATYSTMSVFRAVNIQFANYGASSYELIPWEPQA